MSRTHLLVLLLATLYFLTGKASLELLSGYKIVNIGVFAPEGIALAFALRFGPKVLPGIALGQWVLAVTSGIHSMPALEISLVNTLEAFLGIKLFRHLHLRPTLDTFRDILGLSGIVLFFLQPFSAIFSNILLLLHGEITPDLFVRSTFSWWFGNVMGQLLFTPFLLQLFTHYRNIRIGDYLAAGLLFALYIFALEIPLQIHNPFLLYSLTIPAVVITIAYRGMAYGTMLSVVAATITSCLIYLDYGPFNIGTATENTINFNLFILTYISTVLTIGVLFEERRRYEEKMQKRVEEALNRYEKQRLFIMYQNRLAQMGEMMAMIAHQWRQPLNNLAMLNQLLHSRYKKGRLDAAHMQTFIKNSKKQIAMMSRTIDDFRNFFRPDEKREVFEVAAVVQTIVEMTQNIFSAHGIAFDLHLQASGKSYGYPNALAQAILNIINNAKDALIQKGEEHPTIRIEAVEEEQYVSIRIEDTGGGIPEEILPKIFHPYFSTKSEKNGTGLGLYMAKMLIEKQMGGTIEVFNAKKGASFVIRLPKNPHALFNDSDSPCSG